MGKFWFIVKREFITKITEKAFLMMTFGIPLLVIGIGALIWYLTYLNNDEEKNILVLDKTGEFGETFKNSNVYKFSYFREGNLEEMTKRDKDENGYGVLYIDRDGEGKRVYEYKSIEAPNPNFMQSLGERIEGTLFYKNLEKANIEAEKIDAAKEKVSIKFEDYSGEKSSEYLGFIKIFIGGFVGYVLMFFIMNYGSMVLRSVVEEKSSRIIEIIVSSIKPMNFIMGKIVGTSLVGLAQVVIWAILGVLGFGVFIHFSGIGVENMGNIQQATEAMKGMDADMIEGITGFYSLPWAKIVFSFVMYFIGGYLLYASLYAAIGASVDNETDSQQFMMPIMMVIVVAIYVGLTTISSDPNGTVAVVFSHIPFTSPINMPMRIPFGVSWGEIIISIVILYATFFGMIWLSAKIYRIGILMYGQKPSYKEIYKWLKMKE